MNDKVKVLAICGSVRKQSSNLNLIKAIGLLWADVIDLIIYQQLDKIPHFNPDMPEVPIEVANFCNQIRDADAILICTPEYAMGVPGALKNAIDWTVGTMDFSGKPTALITASLSGEKAHTALMETLLVIEANIPESNRLVIPFIKTKVNDRSEITDHSTLQQVKAVMQSLLDLAGYGKEI
jgi:chromate reductase